MKWIGDWQDCKLTGIWILVCNKTHGLSRVFYHFFPQISLINSRAMSIFIYLKSMSLTHLAIKNPITVAYTYTDDIKLLFYVFIWILALYNRPLGHEWEGIAHQNTLLSFWSEEVASNFQTAKFAKFTFLVFKWSKLKLQILPHCSDLLPLVELWCTLLGSYICKKGLMPFDEVLKFLDDFLLKMPGKKPPEMTITLHRLVEQNCFLNTVLPPCLTSPHCTTKADTTNTGQLHHLCDEVRSMENPPYLVKRFKAM